MSPDPSGPRADRPNPPTVRPESPQPVHERPLLDLPSDEPTGTTGRFVLVACAILGVMIAAAVVVFWLIYWKAQHR